MQWTSPEKTSKFVWHKWFAWYPVKNDDTWYWLENVYRKRVHYSDAFTPVDCMYYIYKAELVYDKQT